jgi:zinc protease
MIWYRVGSRHEKPGDTGISHFLEHLLFKGTKRLGKGEIDNITARNGGFNNAFTSLDYTAYYFTFAADRWRNAIEIEADRMFHTVFDPVEFELERSVILEELKMEQDHPWEVLRKTVASVKFKTHPYRFPIVGIFEDVANLTVSKVRRRYSEYYSPGNATLVIVGDFDTRKALAYVDDCFGSLPAGSILPQETFAETKRTGKINLEVKHPTTIPRLILGVPAPSIHDQDLYAFHLLDKLLTEGKQSRLFQRLIEKERLASMVTSEICETRDPFLLFVRVDAKRQSSLAAVETALLEELSELTEVLPSIDELERAKRQSITQYLYDLETTSDQAFSIGLYETLDSLDALLNYCERIEAVTPEEITSAAQRFFDLDGFVIGSMLPE